MTIINNFLQPNMTPYNPSQMGGAMPQQGGGGLMPNGYVGMPAGQPLYMNGAFQGAAQAQPAYGLSNMAGASIMPQGAGVQYPQQGNGSPFIQQLAYGQLTQPVQQQGYQMPQQQGYQMPQQGGMMPQQGYQMPQQGGMMPQQGYQMPQQGLGQRNANVQQFANANGTNQVATGQFNGNAFVSQFGDNAYQQSFAMNQGQGNLYLQQLGGASGDNVSQIGNFNGNFNHFGFNNTGGNQINYNNIYGQNTIKTFATGPSYNTVSLNNIDNGVRYLTSGNTNLDINHTPQASVLVSGDDGEASNYFIRVSNTYGQKKNSIILNMDGFDQSTVDLSYTFNSSEIFLNGSGRKATIASRNMQKDTIYIDEGTQLDYSQMDAFDTIIVKNADGGLRTFQAGEAQNRSFSSPLLQGMGGLYEASNPGASQMNLQGLFGSSLNNVQLGTVIATGQQYQAAYVNSPPVMGQQQYAMPQQGYGMMPQQGYTMPQQGYGMMPQQPYMAAGNGGSTATSQDMVALGMQAAMAFFGGQANQSTETESGGIYF